MLTTPELPEPGEPSLDDRRQLSCRFIIQAREELEKGNRLQAGEKACGAVAQPLQAIAEQRGWRRQNHQDTHNIGLQMLAETPNVDLQDALPDAPPRPFTIASNAQLRRLRSLTGDDGLQLGDASPVGFSLKHGPGNDAPNGAPVQK